MTPSRRIHNDQGPAQEALEQGLASLAQAAASLGAATFAVLILESESVEIAYRWTAARGILPPSASILCGRPICQALESTRAVTAAESPVAEFLASVVAPQSRSFLLFPWRARPAGVTVVFGFECCEPADAFIPSGLPAGLKESIGLASLAAWSLKEVSRLREELRRANISLAGRKSVERAKGILQTVHGMNERQAYEYLRRTSRQRRIALSKVAEDLVAKDLVAQDFAGAARCP